MATAILHPTNNPSATDRRRSLKSTEHWANGGLRVLSLTATSVTTYLAWVGVTASKVAGCGGSIFSCDHVLSSRWSTWSGVPVSVPALGVHLVGFISLMLALGLFSFQTRKMAWRVSGICVFTAAGAAIWFVGLQLFVLGHLCTYCLIVHVASLAMASIVLVWHRTSVAPRWSMPIALASIAVLATGQLIAEPRKPYEIEFHQSSPLDSGSDREADEDVFEAPNDETLDVSKVNRDNDQTVQAREIQLALRAIAYPHSLLIGQLAQSPTVAAESSTSIGGTDRERGKTEDEQSSRRVVPLSSLAKLDVRQWPLIGQPDAKHILIEMMDYSCQHCRNTHSAVHGAVEAMRGELGVIILPVPLNSACNPTVQKTHAQHVEACDLARLAISVWRTDPKEFAKFHEWLLSKQEGRTFAEAYAFAEQVVNRDTLRDEYSRKTAGEYVTKTVALYKRAGAGTVPKL